MPASSAGCWPPITTAGRASLPSADLALLQLIVTAAARLFGAGAASVLLVDEDEQVLEFRVATGPGNSFAAPHITGLCALILSKHPELTPFQLKTVLLACASNMHAAA